MSVYVDDATHPFGRMLMCHMMADSTEELLAMADRIGVQRKWLQNARTPSEHFDVCKSKREAAIKAGAIPTTGRGLIALVRARRALTPTQTPGVPGAAPGKDQP